MKEEYDLNSVVAPYAEVPEDPKYYMETSRMAKYFEVTLWTLLENVLIKIGQVL